MWRILQDLMWAMVRSFGPADPVDALISLFGSFAQFAVGGLLVGRDHSLADKGYIGTRRRPVDAQGLGRTHPLTPTRRLKHHIHADNPPRPL